MKYPEAKWETCFYAESYNKELRKMGSGVDLLLYINASCVECGDLGPPPDTILGIPPPPLPAFLQRTLTNNSNHTSSSPCSVQCDWTSGPGVEYVELPRQGPAMDDTWLLVLITSCVGVVLLGALLALFLLKCRVQRSGKGSLQLDNSTLGKAKGVKGCEAVLYPCPSAGGAVTPDSRVLWAALTPRGTTQHFAGEPPRYGATLPPPPPVSFDNSGFVDSDDPAPPVESYPLSELPEGSPGPVRGGSPRPRVSSPTRIEHPNLPPLNLHPHHRSLRRPTISRRESDTGPLSPVVL
ncbi:uncharacterized protein [Anabrus simplex]|uniref:uncharacterized protein n=1 Tax=Anabrus simplex TaxID=316456 RepID=UPI0035A34A16